MRTSNENAAGEWPTVSVVVLNYNGKRYLDVCLDSLMRLDYPTDSLEILLVDNGSTDGSKEFVEGKFPGVRIVALEENLGHGEGNNMGVREARGQYVGLLNNDTRVDPGWVKGLLSVISPEDGTVCAASKMLSMDGRSIDFVGAVTSFVGHVWQIDHGSREVESHSEPVPLLFPCSGAMLVDRSVFLQTGGFDGDYFIYFDDVDFGWRLWLLGYRVMLAPDAVTYHDYQGHMRSVQEERKHALFERNALFTLFKNLGEEHLWRFISAAVFLSLGRGFVHLPVGGDALSIGEGQSEEEPREIPPPTLAHWVALSNFVDHLPALVEKRKEVQSKRIRSDGEIFSLFGRPFTAHAYGPWYERLFEEVVEYFEIRKAFPDAMRDCPVGGGA